jgi:hypothetical protein
MADDDKRRRDRPKSSRKDDPRGGPAAMFSALLVAGLIITAAVMLHYGELPAFLSPAASLGKEATVEGKVTSGGAEQKVSVVASVPEKAKVSEQKTKKQQLVTVLVQVRNASSIPVRVAGGEQKLRTGLAHTYKSRSQGTVEVTAGKTRTVKLQFLVPDGEDPGTLTLRVAGKDHKFAVT